MFFIVFNFFLQLFMVVVYLKELSLKLVIVNLVLNQLFEEFVIPILEFFLCWLVDFPDL